MSDLKIKPISVRFSGGNVETTISEEKNKSSPKENQHIIMEPKSSFLHGLKGRLSEKWHEKMPELNLPGSISSFISDTLDSPDKMVIKKSSSVENVNDIHISIERKDRKLSRNASADDATKLVTKDDFELINHSYEVDDDAEEVTENETFDDTYPLPSFSGKQTSRSYPIALNELLELSSNNSMLNENPIKISKKKNSKSMFTTPHLLIGHKHLFIALIVAFLSYMLPINPFISGFLIGVCLMSIFLPTFMFVFSPTWRSTQLPPLPTISELGPVSKTHGLTTENNNSLNFNGWMNLATCKEYNSETFNLSETKSVFLTLTDCILSMKFPANNLPKHAFHEHKPVFIKKIEWLADGDCELDLRNFKIFLLPEMLVQKRLWSKKYPICMSLLNEENNVKVLFARTDLQKEQWFHRLHAASLNLPLPTKLPDINNLPMFSKRGSISTVENLDNENSPSATIESEPVRSLQSLLSYLVRIIPIDNDKKKKTVETIRVLCEPSMIWTNVILSRILWDVLRQPLWSNKIMTKIQKKLSRISKPIFIEDFHVLGINLGCDVPILRRAGIPYIDRDGVWMDIDVAYSGGFNLSIETKVNLLKLKKNNTDGSSPTIERKSAVTNSDEEDSADSVSEDEMDSDGYVSDGVGSQIKKRVNKKKVMEVLDKITNSKYFQTATENKYVQRAMKNVSDTSIQLSVDLKSCVGCLTIHIPHPPTDRIWWGFKQPPCLWITATPKIGQKQINLVHVTEWIENKLVKEMEKIVVMPNMDDICLQPLLNV